MSIHRIVRKSVIASRKIGLHTFFANWSRKVFLLIFLTTQAFAEDVDLFVRQIPDAQRGVVIFIMDTSTSMGALVTSGGGIDLTRMDITKAAASRFIQSAQNINMSLMSFTSDGARVDFPSQNIDNNRQAALDVANGYAANVCCTPLVGALYESYRYIAGLNTRWGGNDSVPAALTGFRFNSPVSNQCQRINVILFTDGDGYALGDHQNDVRSLISGMTLPSGIDSNCAEDECLDEMAWFMQNADIQPSVTGDQNATVYTIAGFGGAAPGILTRTANAGGGVYYNAADATQLDEALGDIMARVRSQESTFTAPVTTTSAFSALETAEDVYFVMFKPEEGVNWRGNLKRYRLGEDNQIYDADGNVAIDPVTGFFSESARSFWSSSPDGQVVEQGGMAEQRSQTVPAYINMSGNTNVSLTSSSNSFHESNSLITAAMLNLISATDRDSVIQWGRGVDVDDEDGDGDTTDDRHSIGDPLHTQPQLINYFGGTDKTIYFTANDGFLYAVNADDGTTEFSFVPEELVQNVAMYRGRSNADTGERVEETFFVDEESAIWHSIELEGIGDFPEAKNQTTRRNVRPGGYRVIYNGHGTTGTITNPQIRIVNGGKRLQITDGGGSWDDYEIEVSEGIFTIAGIDVQYFLPPAAGVIPKVYGMDGPMASWINDLNGDGDILQSNNGTADPGEHAFLYMTMRRGGNNIYALDVTNRNSPVLKWVIRGDVDNDHMTDSTGDFARLGQTWSEPKLARVPWNGAERQVLLFGGGYDVAIDGQATVQNSNIGNAVFMVDADTGALLWSSSNNRSSLNISDLRYSIPASLTLVDHDQDGLTDFFYAVDTGGQLIRFDISETNTGANNFADGGVIARISNSSDSRGVRRFFEAPDVSVSTTFDYLNIAIGSGDRSDPLSDDTDDRIYVFRDPHISQAPTDYTYVGSNIITESNLYDATNNILQEGNDTQRQAAQSSLDSSRGWYVRLESAGEKVISKAATFRGVLLINSFGQNTNIVNQCTPNPGINYLYALNIENAGASFNFGDMTSTTPLDKSNRRTVLRHSTLAPEPSIVTRGSQGSELCVGTECFQNTLRSFGSIPVFRQFWRENR
ncbi:pilus assembly protein [Endozoicomonas elysicola]|uniref:PilY1 beta-propeller domain-containing protein n=1 Tax=Endozoicomonas elysicola TaxID=305900 RepID=A0A081KFA6_9GAMM|nr:PilC/PilY family type IV pilus protein [Endozoicomonas elysicola]KEI72832.1 hypothetical protein GV64_20775 [Endozoicomonas elysicola]